MTMNRNIILLTAAITLGLSACATTSNQANVSPQAQAVASSQAPQAQTLNEEDMTEAELMKQVSENMNQTKTKSTSADGKIICKRQAVVGSNFKRKICGTAKDWDDAAAKTKPVLDRFQRAKAAGSGG